MKVLKTVHSGVAHNANTEANFVEVDLGKIYAREFLITGEVTGDGSASGTLLLNLYYSDVKLASAADAATKLADRKVAGVAKTVPTSDTFQFDWDIAIQRKLARYLYISSTRASFAGAITFTSRIVRVPSTYQDGVS